MPAKLQNGNSYIEIEKLTQIDNDLEINIKAKSSFLQINFKTYVFSYALKKFYEKLSDIQNKLYGEIINHHFNYEEDFQIDITYLKAGHIKIEAFFKSTTDFGNKTFICFETDQTYITEFLTELEKMLN